MQKNAAQIRVHKRRSILATEFVACSKPQAEIIIVKRLIQGRNNVTRVWVEHRLCD